MRVWWVAVPIAAALVSPAAFGEMEGDEYLPAAPRMSQEQVRERQQKVLEDAIQDRIAAEVQQEVQRRQQEQELAARPPAQRLLEQRCTGCHAIELVTLRPRTRIGWTSVTLRMQWINGATLEPGERALITTYLATHHAAPTRRLLVELAAGMIIVALIGGLSLHRIRARGVRDSNRSRNDS